ncbi:hypothetical protein [Nitrosopumilus sp.]|uniref:hypothetical protein n=1 Tax=Nitrosopumilus sp. TaxID=2024843 RepID=UPI003D113571
MTKDLDRLLLVIKEYELSPTDELLKEYQSLKSKIEEREQIVDRLKEEIEDLESLKSFKPECGYATLQKHEGLEILKRLQSILTGNKT